MSALPDQLPIVRERVASGRHRTPYVEPELHEPVDLCDAGGRLNPASVGWSRRPLVRANLSGHWLRKKRWNFWNWITPDFVLSATVADIDYASFCEIAFTDFATRKSVSAMAFARPGTIAMPEHVERTISFSGKRIDYRNVNDGDGGDLAVAIRADARGVPIVADLAVARPRGHESLNIVVPWSESRFQLNSKHAALPTSGRLRVGDREYAVDPGKCHAVQDFGRGVWPYRSFWNWAVATGVEDGVLVGVNLGARWTTGTGVNENGLSIGGRLHKIMEDLDWSYDPAQPMRPWRITAPRTGMVDVTLEPLAVRSSRIDLGLLRTGGVCCFGRWNGVLRFDGRELAIRSMIGWAEEFDHRW